MVQQEASDAEQEEEDDDYELGQVLNEIAQDSTHQGDEAAKTDGNADDEEVSQLREYLTEMQADFKQQKVEQEAELAKIRDERAKYSDFISKVKLQGISDERDTHDQAMILLGTQEGTAHPVLKAISGALQNPEDQNQLANLMPWSEENRDKLKVLSM